MTNKHHNTKKFYKPKLAFISPMPPEKTGIADYSAELIEPLSKFYEIELVTNQQDIELPALEAAVKIRPLSWLIENSLQYDRVLYHFGNSPCHSHMLTLLKAVPGVVVLHDFYIGNLYEQVESKEKDSSWTEALYLGHGYKAVRERFESPSTAAFEYPCSFDVIRRAVGCIVHSEASQELVVRWYGDEFREKFAIIPLLRIPVISQPSKAQAKAALGFRKDDYILCSYGFLGETKLNHRVIDAWAESSISGSEHSYLIFVGEVASEEYKSVISEKIKNSPHLKNKIKVTGYLSKDDYKLYLSAADLAVQLRENTRGEVSAAVLDCMNYSIPTIVNACGAMTELDGRGLNIIEESFTDLSLKIEIDRLFNDRKLAYSLSQYARETLENIHNPEKCAESYYRNIEKFYDSMTPLNKQIDGVLMRIEGQPTNQELKHYAKDLASKNPLNSVKKRIFLDVTVTALDDYKTGIQRVVRAIQHELIYNCPEGYRVEPIRVTDEGGEWHYRHACAYTLSSLNCPDNVLFDHVVEPQNGDILLVLDLTGGYLIETAKAGVYKKYRDAGVSVISTVYDLLPVLMPGSFPEGASEAHHDWLLAISEFDGVICISKSVAKELDSWLKECKPELWQSYTIDWFHLGADVDSSAPSKGLPSDASSVLELLSDRCSFLMVGTLEPRKGHTQVLEAFEQLWQVGVDINLVVVGKQGWMVDSLVDCIDSHPELNKRLFWLEGISDEYLEKVYAASTCLIAASYGEGFGLPLIEAAQHKLPIIARDIPVFREVAGVYAYYFSADKADSLATALKEWLELYDKQLHPKSDDMPWLTWKESARQLLNVLLKDEANRSKNTSHEEAIPL